MKQSTRILLTAIIIQLLLSAVVVALFFWGGGPSKEDSKRLELKAEILTIKKGIDSLSTKREQATRRLIGATPPMPDCPGPESNSSSRDDLFNNLGRYADPCRKFDQNAKEIVQQCSKDRLRIEQIRKRLDCVVSLSCAGLDVKSNCSSMNSPFNSEALLGMKFQDLDELPNKQEMARLKIEAETHLTKIKEGLTCSEQLLDDIAKSTPSIKDPISEYRNIRLQKQWCLSAAQARKSEAEARDIIRCGYASKRDEKCGVERYFERKSEHCGVKAYKVGNGDVCGPKHFHRCRTAACGWHKCGFVKKCKQKECEAPPCGVREWNSCANPKFGVESYNTCRHPAHGVELYKECALPEFGWKKCE